MNNNYTNSNIDKFFEQFKRLPDYFELEKVHQLVSNPDAKAKLSGKTFFKPLNLIFMTTMFITGLTVLTFWLSPTKTETSTKIGMQQQTDSIKYERKIQNKKTSTTIIPQPTKPNTSNVTKPVQQDAPIGTIQPAPKVLMRKEFNMPASNNKALLATNCNWPKDTMLNKHNLFIQLTETERERVGLFYRVDSTKRPAIERYRKLYKDGINSVYKLSKKGTLLYNSGFNVCYTSDTACVEHRWNSPFYNSIDTLIPVVHLNRIYWFYPIAGVFDSLPERYQYLRSVYKSLQCLKQQNPDNQYINYWNKNILRGDIKYITLSQAELSNIGFKFDKDSNGYYIVNPTTRKSYWGIKQSSGDISLMRKPKSSDSIIPVSVPILRTDEKGLGQRIFKEVAQKIQIASISDILIPIKIPLNEYIKGCNYYDIYWYNPTDSFINCLPERIRTTLKAEKESIIKNTPTPASTGCIYYEACQSTLQLDNLIVFPNPAIGTATVQFSVNIDIEAHISLSNMAGVTIRQLTSSTPLKAGYHSLQIDLTSIQPGIYLLTVVSNKGFKTKRLIVMQ